MTLKTRIQPLNPDLDAPADLTREAGTITDLMLSDYHDDVCGATHPVSLSVSLPHGHNSKRSVLSDIGLATADHLTVGEL